ncbi:MAG: hypothetical protein Q9220_001645 [cf. Caloplaca sp. 1 TL-2023]
MQKFGKYPLIRAAWENATTRQSDRGRVKFQALIVSSVLSLISLILIVHSVGRIPCAQDSACSNPPAIENLPASELSTLSSEPPASQLPTIPLEPPEESLIEGPTKIATIIENRPLSNLIPLIASFHSVLGPEWPIRVFYGPNNARLLKTSPLIRRMMDQGHITLQALPSDPEYQFTVHEDVSAVLTRPWIWEQLAPAEHVLTFQTDSILCSNSRHSVDEFLGYDFIGALIQSKPLKNFNGGLSIRNREKMLEVVNRSIRQPNTQFEDQWFVERLRELPWGANLPSVEVAAAFAVESVWHDRPFGVHQVSRWHPEKLEELKLWCPEYQLAVDGSLYPGHGEEFALVDVEPADENKASQTEDEADEKPEGDAAGGDGKAQGEAEGNAQMEPEGNAQVEPQRNAEDEATAEGQPEGEVPPPAAVDALTKPDNGGGSNAMIKMDANGDPIIPQTVVDAIAKHKIDAAAKAAAKPGGKPPG